MRLHLFGCCLMAISLQAVDHQALAEAIDAAQEADLAACGLSLAPACEDGVFLRRLWLDVCGRLPPPQLARSFLGDDRPDKRERVIEQALAEEAYADFQAMRWAEMLRIKAEYPIKLWPNAVQAYYRWLQAGLAGDRSWRAMTRELLTASGSNFRVPAVNFYRAVQAPEPAQLAGAALLTFLGQRFDTLPVERQTGLQALFARIAFKGTAEWKEEIVHCDPAPAPAFTALLPDGSSMQVPADADPRPLFADWLLTGGGAADFAAATADRWWAWLMGHGIVDPVDDRHAENPPANPQLLAALGETVTACDFVPREFLRCVLRSRTYQQSARPQGTDLERALRHFACYPVRPLEAEVLFDILHDCFTGSMVRKRYRDRFSSQIPEPFTYLPAMQRAVAIGDGSITSSLLDLFGRPPRDTGLADERESAVNRAQRLHLLNASSVQEMITSSALLGKLKGHKGQAQQAVEEIYCTLLTRRPLPAEWAALKELAAANDAPRDTAVDIVWAIINSKEFLYRH